MNIPQTVSDIIERHESRLNACGDKLMNAERDLDTLLNIFEENFAPIILAAKAVHDTGHKNGAGVLDLVIPLSVMSAPLEEAGLV